MGPSRQQSLFESTPAGPNGFAYHENAITKDEERALLARIQPLPFKEFAFHGFDGKRRVVSFGWRYDFGLQQALPADPIPSFLRELHERVQARSGFEHPCLEQVLVTEYAPGAPIGWHRDRPVYRQIMGLSLLSPCAFRLRRKKGTGWERHSLELFPRSAYFLDGPARWEWEHSIPPLDELRYSITFRNRS